jgi:hypothetical protein
VRGHAADVIGPGGARDEEAADGAPGEPLADRARPGTGTTALGDTVASGPEAGRPAGQDADGTPRPDPTRDPDTGPGVARPPVLDADGTLLAAASVRLAGRTAPTGGDAPAARAPSPGTPTGPAWEAPPPGTARRPPFRLGHLDALPLGIQLGLGLTGSLVLGTLSHRYVERPLIHRARRHRPAAT